MEAWVWLVQVVGEGMVQINIGPRRENNPGVFRAPRKRMTRGEFGPEIRFDSLGRLSALAAILVCLARGKRSALTLEEDRSIRRKHNNARIASAIVFVLCVRGGRKADSMVVAVDLAS